MSTASSSRVLLRLLSVGLAVLALGAAGTQDRLSRGHRWVATWTASVQGPYPSGNPSAQPVLDFAFESPQRGATDQTFRLVVKPDLWGARIRLRFANTFGSQPLTLDDIYVGLQSSGGNIAYGTSEHVTFNGRRSMTIPPGRSLYTDPVTLRFVNRTGPSLLHGRRLAVSFHTPGSTGPMTWHAKALTTSYISAPGAGSHSADETDTSFPFTTTSWYFLDAIDVLAADDTMVVACFGDSITDGTGSTLNGDDRWPDVLARRLHAAYGGRVSVVNAGIGGNQVTGPSTYNPAAPFAGGPSALERLDRDIFGIASLSSVVWLEGINDLSAGASAETVIAGLREGIRRLHAHGGVRVIGATITSSVGATTASGTPDVDTRRQAINAFIRTGGAFDGVIDFDAATRDPQSGGLRAVFQPNSTIGGAGDRLHPNRAGYQAMGHAIDLRLFAPRVGP
jgi:lysophospholipase L1-like esterase